MRTGPLRQVSVLTTAQAEEAVAELLAGEFGLAATTQTDLEKGTIAACVYLPAASPWSIRQRRHLSESLEALRARGVDVGSARIRTRRLQPEDWASSWKRHFKPLAVGGRLLIKPSWSKRQPGRDQAVVVLDPGLSFGTGNHPTTLFCLGQLVKATAEVARPSVLDLGTGSGILAIAAVKLGCAGVMGLDYDADAVRIARANARTNRVERRLRFFQQDLTRGNGEAGRERFDVVCANLMADLLLAERRRILGFVRPGGRLVLAGILHEQLPGVLRAYGAGGARVLERRRVGEWESCALVCPARRVRP
jgi:ribosomal protein L11 methyltransferase